MIDFKLLDSDRQDFFLRTQGGIVLPIIGTIFWPAVGIAGFYLSPQVWCITVLTILFISFLISGIFLKNCIQQFVNKSPLATLIFPSLFIVLSSFFVTISIFFYDILLVPLLLVLGLAIHWPIIGWLYNQPIYLIHSLLRTITALTIWFLYPEYLFTLLPILVGVLYFITALWLWHTLRQLKLSL